MRDIAGELPPSDWVVRWAAEMAAGGWVLDLACGRGRHARYLAALGFAVRAVDQQAELLAPLAEVPGVTVQAADLEGDVWPLAGETYAGVVVTHYLYRPRFRALMDLLAPGGVLIYETFMAGNEAYGRPRNPDFLLQPGELLAVVRQFGLTVLAFEEGPVGDPVRAVTQRLCARRPVS